MVMGEGSVCVCVGGGGGREDKNDLTLVSDNTTYLSRRMDKSTK